MAAAPIDTSPTIESDNMPAKPSEDPRQEEASTSIQPADRSSYSRSRSRSHSRSRSASPSRAIDTEADPPQLPDDEIPPLPNEAPPEDDGWAPVWDEAAQAYYFYNRFTHATQWENPRVPDATSAGAGAGAGAGAAGLGSHDRISSSGAPGTASSSSGAPGTSSPQRRLHGGYNPAIHGDYDPDADYAIEAQTEEEKAAAATGLDPNSQYAATGFFNRFTGRWQAATLAPENFNDENKSKRQMSAFFDVDAAANSHDGRSLKAERQGKKLTKQEVKAFREKRREKKEEKRRAWLRD